ncbi:7-carboxy-7-deazaguanine synthase QueE [Bartonella sp. DGB1]|uniref:7-carboxy-7-deazaguanine synthase QueE n=1 Tax=Bartonella sp. DGB1 TaxID=3239807 RepID=UPI003526A2B3
MKKEIIRVSEIFGPTIQGEGALIGMPTVFVRTGGCDYRCSWCDSLHAVDSIYRNEWLAMEAADILDEIIKLSNNKALLVSLSGGNPAIQPFEKLISMGKKLGYSFAMETQGSIAQNWFSLLDYLILSPKPPSSNMAFNLNYLTKSIKSVNNNTKVILKFVVFNETDYKFAKEIANIFPFLPIYLQPGNHTPPQNNQEDADIDLDGILDRTRWLIEHTILDKWYNVKILPQLHTLIWGNKRGV